MKKNIIPILTIPLFILSTISPIAFGYNFTEIDKDISVENHYLNAYHRSELLTFEKYYHYSKNTSFENFKSVEVINSETSPRSLDGLMDSPWPMYCHDNRHTGQSPYKSVDTYDEIWKFRTINWPDGGPAIDENGIIYIGSWYLYAVYPNGTLKWEYDTHGIIDTCPAIDEEGTIYVGNTFSDEHYLNAIYSNGTLKWKYKTGEDVYSSPAINNDGTIYFGDANHFINALYPNGTLRWKYKTGHVVYSSPAIGDDGTVYCGSHDTYLYAFYPNNGTLKWKYKTGDWIRTSPCIDDDGNIYVVSLDSFLHAVNPNGTMKWKTDVGAGTSPTISQDGTIYAGYTNLHAVNPTNGSIKWKFNVAGTIRGGTPCNSIDGTIYIGTSDGGQIIAVNPNGTEKWRKSIGECESPPAIGEDGTIYIGSHNLYLYAFGELDPDAPSAPSINGQINGKTGTEYEYSFKSISPLGRNVYYYITWGDGSKKDWSGPFNSGEEITVNHSWSEQGTYTINARAKDTENLWGPWGELTVTMPRNKEISNTSLFRFLKRYSLLERFLTNL